MKTLLPVTLGSSSPQRFDLIQKLFPNCEISVTVPLESEERDISGLTDFNEITNGLLQIAGDKNEDVVAQLSKSKRSLVLTADTGVIVKNDENTFRLLGKPPLKEYRQVVQQWFENYYLGKTHFVVTAVCLSDSSQPHDAASRLSSVVTSQVKMPANLHNRIAWYLDTKEPLGKAGGYAIQGAGSLFVEKVTGSISNIIGLPLKETLALFEQIQSP